MKTKLLSCGLFLLTTGAALLGVTTSVHAADKKPNIIMIFADVVGPWNVLPRCS